MGLLALGDTVPSHTPSVLFPRLVQGAAGGGKACPFVLF